jgi:cysteine dioxygenase
MEETKSSLSKQPSCLCSPTLECDHQLPMSERKMDLFEVVDGIKEALSSTSPTSEESGSSSRKRTQEEHEMLSTRLTSLLGDLDLSLGELSRYAHFCSSKKYTRNLIASDANFTLMLLCWTPGKESPIHDHPCEGCWMRVCTGRIRETVYKRHASTNSLSELKSREGNAGDVLYVDDSIGYHKVGSEVVRKVSTAGSEKEGKEGGRGVVYQISEDADGQPLQEGASITLHLYSPPFLSCSVWLSEDAALDAPCRPTITYHSEFGVKLYEDDSLSSNALTGGGGGGLSKSLTGGETKEDRPDCLKIADLSISSSS